MRAFTVLAAMWVMMGTVDAGTAGVRMHIASLNIEGFDDEAAAVTREALLRELDALGIQAIPQPAGEVWPDECLKTPDCVRQACEKLEVAGLLDIEVLRTGPMVRVTTQVYGGAFGAKLHDSSRAILTEAFPTEKAFTEEFVQAIETLRGPAAAEQPEAETSPDAEPRVATRPEVSPAPPETQAEKTPEPQPETAKPEPAPAEVAPDKPVVAVAAPPPSRSSSKSTWGWVLVGVGGTLLASSAVTGGFALSMDKDLAGTCVGGTCPPDRQDDIDLLDKMTLTTDILLGVGAASVVAGILLLTVFDDDPEQSPGVTVSPSVGADYAGAVLQGRF